MIYLLLSIICATIIIALFKVFEVWPVRIFRVIVINYFVCVVMGLLFEPSAWPSDFHAEWLKYAFILGLLFITGFYLMSRSVNVSGLTVSSVASKTSFILSATGAMLLFHEPATWQKSLAIIIAVPAVLLTMQKPGRINNLLHGHLAFPVLVLISSGIIELLLKYSQEYALQPEEFHQFLIFLFGTAAFSGLILTVAHKFTGNKRASSIFPKREWLAGVLLGIPNYGSIYFLVRVLDLPGWQASVVYPVNNVGIVSMSALTAMLFFHEKLSRPNWIGLILTIGCILLAASSL